MDYQKRIANLRQMMAQKDLAAYIVPADSAMEYLSGETWLNELKANGLQNQKIGVNRDVSAQAVWSRRGFLLQPLVSNARCPCCTYRYCGFSPFFAV